MRPTISIYNPLSRARAGYVTVPWNDFRRHFTPDDYPEHGFVLRDLTDCEIPYQIDTVDPDDPSKKYLVLALPTQVPSGPEDCSRPSMAINISQGQSQFTGGVQARLSGSKHGVELTNGILTIYISFSRIHDDATKPWYAGSATTVQLNGQEILAFAEDFLQHDPEKRCIQIDHLYLPSHSEAPQFDLKVDLFNSDYNYVTHSDGPVRASVTIASVPFRYTYADAATGGNRTIECRLYRVISLYVQADYVLEELYVKNVSDSYAVPSKTIVPPFIARYYSHMDFGHMPDLFQFADIPGWFSVGANWFGMKPGYGFGTTSRTSPVFYPHRDTSVLYDEPVHEKEFSWLLFPCKSATNMHAFMRRNGKDFDDETGRRWHDIIYRGLQARIVCKS